MSFNKIIITGPESSGKSTLADALGQHLELPVVGEYAVEYLRNTNGEYTYEDIKEIALGQYQREMEALKEYGPPIICDTSMLVLKIWSEVRFGRVDNFIIDCLENCKGDFFLLCKPDIEWTPGPFRENPSDRDQLFERYVNFLAFYDCNWGLIEGEKRLKLALGLLRDIEWNGKNAL